MKRSDVVSAAKGAQLIVHAVNPPGYKNWEQQSIPMLENTIEAAKASRARILFPGTLYNFGPETPQPLTENSEQKTHTKKGQIRIRMEELLKKASSEGAPVLIVRAGDFFGPHPGNNWFSQGLIKPGALIRTINYPGKRGVGHSWAYLPDLAETMVKLVEQEGRLSAFEVFHFEGQWDNDGTQMIDAIIRASGRSDVKVRRMPCIFLRLLSPFVTLFK
jgi:nucleoside-diphosphate-sugar epimerase